MRLHPLRVTTILCSAGFDATLHDLLRDARSVGPQAAVSHWAGALDETFLPMLDARLDAAADRGEEARCAELMDLMEAVEQACAAERAVDACIASHWGTLDGVIDEAEEEEVDLHGLPEGAPRPFVGDRASTYGEVTRSGARALFRAMGLTLSPNPNPNPKPNSDENSDEAPVFFDLGSGTGRLVAHAYLELPHLAGAVGVELAPSRHAAAVRAWASLLASGSPLLAAGAGGRVGGGRGGPEFRQASILETDLSSATHVYVSSLCMPDAILDALWSALHTGAPRLQVIASLKEFRGQTPTSTAAAQMTWNRAGSDGAPLYVYRVDR